MVSVSISDGMLQGEVIQNDYGGTYCSFKGIPYAEPPSGDLRFKAPQPVLPWTGIRNAKEFGPVCYQYNPTNPNLGNMSEDCLYLNVYTPEVNPNRLIPVMFWIHAGGFTWGSGNDDFYGPEFLVKLGVILVTFNYRLEALGLLCLHTEDVPGNAGMKDQVAALRWVKKNIKIFGGDPENITIFGESAGGASVAYHLVSPMTKGLFKRAIIQSGATTCWWSQDFATIEKAILLAKQLGCHSDDINELYEFFKIQPIDSLINLNLQMWKAQKSYDIYFGIVSEKDFGQEVFFSGDIMETLRNNVHEGLEIIIGYTQDEGLMSLAVGNSLDIVIAEAGYYNEFFVPREIKIKTVVADQMVVAQRMKEFYYKDVNRDVLEQQLISFQGMDMFVYGVMLSAKLLSMKYKTYLYKFTSHSQRNFMANVFGLSDVVQGREVVCHADDLPYLFPLKLASTNVSEKSKEFELITRVTTLWTNFAKYSNPTPNDSLGVIWKPYTLEKQEYLNIGNNLTMYTSPNREELELWNSIFKEYFPKYAL